MLTLDPRPAAAGPGAFTEADGKPLPSATSTFIETGAVPSATLLPEAVTPAASAQTADAPRDGAERPAERDLPRIIPGPAIGRQSLAQIPTEVMEEISRLRQEEAQLLASGVPGRNDPTPMPASPQAIGAADAPYGAA